LRIKKKYLLRNNWNFKCTKKAKEDQSISDHFEGLISIKDCVEAKKIKVIIMAEAMHQAHVAPITNGSMNVRYMENRIPINAINQTEIELNLRIDLGPNVSKNHIIRIEK